MVELSIYGLFISNNGVVLVWLFNKKVNIDIKATIILTRQLLSIYF